MKRREDKFGGFALRSFVGKVISGFASVICVVLSLAWIAATLAGIAVGTVKRSLMLLVLLTPFTCTSVVLGAVLWIWANDARRRWRMRMGVALDGDHGFLVAGAGTEFDELKADYGGMGQWENSGPFGSAVILTACPHSGHVSGVARRS